MSVGIEKYIDNKGKLLAMVIRAEYQSNGIEFLTDDSHYQQVAAMGHPEGHIILPHYHNIINRNVDLTNETLVIKRGILAVDLYDDNQAILYKFEVKSGDILTLFSGGHGFKAIENLDMVEIKQGPFMGDADKTRFSVEEN